MLFLNLTPLMSLIPQHFLALHLPPHVVGICWVPAGLAPFILPGLPKTGGGGPVRWRKGGADMERQWGKGSGYWVVYSGRW